MHIIWLPIILILSTGMGVKSDITHGQIYCRKQFIAALPCPVSGIHLLGCLHCKFAMVQDYDFIVHNIYSRTSNSYFRNDKREHILFYPLNKDYKSKTIFYFPRLRST